jgi:hypothetical protein
MLPAATGNADTIGRIATTYGVRYGALAVSAATGDSVNHTAMLMIVERDRYRGMTLPFESAAECVGSNRSSFPK